MAKNNFILVAIVVALSVELATATKYPPNSACSRWMGGMPDPRKQTPPALDGGTYNAVYEYMTITNDSSTFNGPFLFEENVDGQNKIFSSYISFGGVNSTYIKDDKNRQSFDISYSNVGPPICKVLKYGERDNYLQFGNITLKIANDYFLYELITIDPIHVLGYGGLREGQDRGIQMEHWSYCIDQMYLINVFWTIGERDPYTKQMIQKPVIVNIYSPNNSSETFNVFHFQRNEVDISKLKTPSGVYCPGRTSNKKFPIDTKTLTSFRFKSEEYNPQTSKISWSNHWYDFVNDLRRIDFEDTSVSFDAFTKSYILFSDSEYGFEINRMNGSCKVKLIIDMKDEATIFQNITFSEKGHASMFFCDAHTNNYTYIGERKSRGMKTNVFQGLKENYPYTNVTSVLELYFKYTFGEEEPTFPVSLFVSPYSKETKEFRDGNSLMYYFYDWYTYSSEESDLDAYDVTSCFDDDQKTDVIFQIAISGGKTTSTLQFYVNVANSPFVKSAIRKQIATFSKVDIVKINNVRSYFEDSESSIYIAYTVLGHHSSLPLGYPSLQQSIANFKSSLDAEKFVLISKFDKSDVEISGIAGSVKYLYNDSFVGKTTVKPHTTMTTKLHTNPTTSRPATKPSTRPATKPSTRPATKPATSQTTSKLQSRSTSSKPTIPSKTTPNQHHTSAASKPVTKTLPTASAVTGSDVSKGYSSGILAGSAIGSLVAGLVFGALVTFVVIRFSGKSFFGISIQ